MAWFCWSVSTPPLGREIKLVRAGWLPAFDKHRGAIVYDHRVRMIEFDNALRHGAPDGITNTEFPTM